MAAELSASKEDPTTGGVLFVGDYPGSDEDAKGRPQCGETGKYLREQIRKHYKGPLVLTSSILCFPDGRGTDTPLEACRPYLYGVIRESQPSRILLCGAHAIESVTGRSLPPLSVRGGHTFLVTDVPCSGSVVLPGEALSGGKRVPNPTLPHDPDCPYCAGFGLRAIPVFYLFNPVNGLRNRFVRGAFEGDLQVALTATPNAPSAWGGFAAVVETKADALKAGRDLRKHGGVTFDGESAGKMFNRSYRVLSFACTPMGESYAWVWPRQALDQPEVRHPLQEIMNDASIAKGGQYIQTDLKMAFLEFGSLPVGGMYDALLAGKLLNPDARGALELSSELVGLGGHKQEMEEAKYAGLSRFRDWWRRHKECDASGQRKGGQLLLVREKPPSPAEFPLMSEALLLELGAVLDHPDNKDPRWAKNAIESYVFGLVKNPDVLLRYNARDAVSTDALVRHNFAGIDAHPILRQTWDENVGPMIRDVAQIECWGMPCSAAAVEMMLLHWSGRAATLREKFRPYGWDSDPGKSTFSPDSAKQVATLLYEKLGITVPWTTDDDDSTTGSTEKEALERIKGEHPVVPLLIEYKVCADRVKTDLRRFIRDDGRIHCYLHMDGARTGRFSCSEPNLQNRKKPSKTDPESAMERDCFSAASPQDRPGEEWVFCEVDFGQIQPRIAAGLSGDAAFIRAVSEGDFHTNAARIFARVLWGDPNAEITPDRRQQVKPIDLAALFDDDPYGLALREGISKETAEGIFRALFGAFRDFKTWYQGQVRLAQENGGVWTWWNGRPCRWRPLWHIADPPEPNGRPGRAYRTDRRSSWNTPIQGTEIDFLLASVHALVEWFHEDCIPAEISMVIHDSILMRVRKDVLPEVVTRAKEIMTGWKMPCDAPLVVDVKVGSSFGSLSDYKE